MLYLCWAMPWAAAQEPIKLRFDWPDRVDAQVEHTLVSTTTARGLHERREGRATANLTATRQGRHTVVSFQDYQLDVVSASPRMHTATVGALLTTSWWCDAQLDRRGRLKASWLDDCGARLHEQLRTLEGPGAYQFRQQLSDPVALELAGTYGMIDALGLAWVGERRVPGQETRETVVEEIPVLGSFAELEGVLVSRVTEPTPCPRLGQPACVEIQQVMEFDSDQLLSLIAQAFGDQEVGRMTLRTETTILVERDTLLPHASRSRTFTDVIGPSGRLVHDSTTVTTRVIYKDSTPFDPERLAPDHPFRQVPRTHAGAVQATQAANQALGEQDWDAAALWAAEATDILLALDPAHPDARYTAVLHLKALRESGQRADARDVALAALARWPAAGPWNETEWMLRGDLAAGGARTCVQLADPTCLASLRPVLLDLAIHAPSAAYSRTALRLAAEGVDPRAIAPAHRDLAVAQWWALAQQADAEDRADDAGLACMEALYLERSGDRGDPALGTWCLALSERSPVSRTHRHAFQVGLAEQRHRSHDHAGAAALLQDRVDEDPDIPPFLRREMRVRQADERRHQGELDAALALLRTSRPDPEDPPEAHAFWQSVRNRTLLELGEPAPVVQETRALLQTLGDDPSSPHRIARLELELARGHLGLGELDSAAALLVAAEAREAGLDHPSCQLGRALSTAQLAVDRGEPGAQAALDQATLDVIDFLGPGHWALRLYQGR